MKICYTQVSTADEDLTVQIKDLKRAGCERIYSDKARRAKTRRPRLQQALEYMREGDLLVVWRLDRLGRSLIHLIEPMSLLEEMGIGYPCETETGIDLTTLESRFMCQWV